MELICAGVDVPCGPAGGAACATAVAAIARGSATRSSTSARSIVDIKYTSRAAPDDALERNASEFHRVWGGPAAPGAARGT